MVDAESRAFSKMPKEARLEFIKLLDPILDILDSLGEIGFQDPYEGWDYTGSLTDAMAEMYHKGFEDGYEQCAKNVIQLKSFQGSSNENS